MAEEKDKRPLAERVAEQLRRGADALAQSKADRERRQQQQGAQPKENER